GNRPRQAAGPTGDIEHGATHLLRQRQIEIVGGTPAILGIIERRIGTCLQVGLHDTPRVGVVPNAGAHLLPEAGADAGGSQVQRYVRWAGDGDLRRPEALVMPRRNPPPRIRYASNARSPSDRARTASRRLPGPHARTLRW